jgi:hypothetical protein
MQRYAIKGKNPKYKEIIAYLCHPKYIINTENHVKPMLACKIKCQLLVDCASVFVLL